MSIEKKCKIIAKYILRFSFEITGNTKKIPVLLLDYNLTNTNNIRYF